LFFGFGGWSFPKRDDGVTLGLVRGAIGIDVLAGGVSAACGGVNLAVGGFRVFGRFRVGGGFSGSVGGVIPG
jgi:hypothetical protein